MKQNICYVVGAGENHGINFIPQSGDYVIAADGGLNYLVKAKIKADMVIGDFDSLVKQPKHENVVVLNVEKDETDTFAAIKQGIEKGYTVFHLYGCTGGRIDHTIANIQILAYLAEHEMQGIMFGKNEIITAITNAMFSLPPYEKGYVSIFSYTEKAEGVSLKGLKYPLDNATITNTFPIGVSNEFLSTKSTIEVKKGTLIITYSKKQL